MKTISICIKSLKIVARNKAYFVVLVICPILLILLSGLLLNSNNYENIGVGLINEGSNYNFDVESIKNLYYYNTLQDCLYDLTNSKVSVCMHVKDVEGKHKISIYSDNTRKKIEYYAKQFVLQKILDEQTLTFKETSLDITSQIILYTNSVDDAVNELKEVSVEMDAQEQVMLNYKDNLAKLRSDFNDAYVPLKESEQDIIRIRNDLSENNENLKNNISLFRERSSDIQVQIDVLKNYLSTRLSAAEYDYVLSSFQPIEENLYQIGDILDNLEEIQGSTEEIVVYLNSLELLISKLDSIKETLDKLDKDLDLSIKSLQESKVRINLFRSQLEESSNSMRGLSQQEKIEDVSIDFFNAFPITDNPAFLAFPLLITMIITFTSLVLSNMFILKQVNMESYFRDLISPTSDSVFLFSDYFVNLIFISIQSLVLFFVGYFWFDVSFSVIWIFALAIFLAASIFIFIGMSIAYLIHSEGFSMLITVFFLMLLLTLSDLLSPIFFASQFARFFINLNPFVILSDILNNLLILGSNFNDLTPKFSKLAIFLIFSIIFSYISKKICRRKFVE